MNVFFNSRSHPDLRSQRVPARFAFSLSDSMRGLSYSSHQDARGDALSACVFVDEGERERETRQAGVDNDASPCLEIDLNR